MGQLARVLVEEGEERTKDPLEVAKGHLKDPHRSALREESQVLLHPLHFSYEECGDKFPNKGKGRENITVLRPNGR